MNARLQVQILEEGRLLQEVPFSGERLQIGRLPENDVVINHLSVSRTHAQLERDGDRVIVEDLGSQNGVWVNDERVDGSRELARGDTIRVGKHELRVVEAESELTTPEAELVEAESELAAAEAELAAPEADLVVAESMPEADLVVAESMPEADLVAAESMPEADLVAAEADVDEFAIEEHEVTGGESLDEGIADLTPEELWEPGDEEATPRVEVPAEEGAGVENFQPDLQAPYPGLIVRRSGQPDRLLAWHPAELFAGRAAECELFLGAAEVSKRHAVFSRVGDCHEVRDLDSTNGVLVNGERVESRVLSPGDVVSIESFELTFVMEHEPIAGATLTPSEPSGEESVDAEHLDPTLLREPLASGAAEAIESTAPGMADELQTFDLGQEPEGGEEAKDDLPQTGGRVSPPLRLELEICADALPEPLRHALADLGDEILELPATLRLRRGGVIPRG